MTTPSTSGRLSLSARTARALGILRSDLRIQTRSGLPRPTGMRQGAVVTSRRKLRRRWGTRSWLPMERASLIRTGASPVGTEWDRLHPQDEEG